MPIQRRRPDPADLAAVLHRLERLRIGPPPPGDPGPAAVPPPAAAPPGQLASWRRGRFDPGRRGLAVLAILALFGAMGGAWYFVSAAASGAASPGPPSRTTTASPAAGHAAGPPGMPVPPALASGWPTEAVTGAVTKSSTSPSPSPIVVDVVGRVGAPGVVQLPAGARIQDAIRAAGGLLPGTDLTALDLASRLRDGQEVFVGIPPPSGAAARAAGGLVDGLVDGAVGGAVGGVAPPPGAGASPSLAVVDLNIATSQQLESLPGVGPVLAQHIIDWRARHGAFTSVAQLQQVSGIGPAKYAALAAHVSV